MLLPISWLKEYIDIDTDTKELTDRLSQSGSHVESVLHFDKGNDNIVVAEIKAIEKHPNADKLSLVTVDYGTEQTIITGAKNMKVGDKVAFAKLGATLQNGLVIKPVKLKGIESSGMLCSYEELGYSSNLVPKNSREGIMILDPAVEIGTDITHALQIDQPTIEFEITPNRSDCLSVIGMAREVAATFGTKLTLQKINIVKEEDCCEDYFDSVSIQTDKCLRYVGRIAKDVVVKESPQWIKNYLMQAGMRPINNIVDITNYVMLEYGQPIHAFDIRQLEEKKIIVRQAVAGEKMTTLDGVDRILDESMTVIADEKKANALAGIMGGLTSEVEEDTKIIFIESAAFDRESIRKTSKKLSLRTEASLRFEKGISPHLVRKACDRVCELLEQTQSATIIKGAFDNYPVEINPVTITLSTEKVNQLLGTSIQKAEMINILENLDFTVEKIEERKLKVTVPTFRIDVTIYQDLIEEIGRIYGFHNIKPQPIIGEILKGQKDKHRQIEDKLQKVLYALGLYEIATYSFISPKAYDRVKYKEDEASIVRIKNPLGEDYSIMRTTLISNMMAVLERNSKYKVDKLKCYELGNTFFRKENSLPIEKKKLVIGLYGKYSFYDLKEMLDILLKEFDITSQEYVRCTDLETFHRGRCAKVMIEGETLAIIGEINFDVMEQFDMNERANLLELDVNTLIKYQKELKYYKKVIKFPIISRDLAIVVDRDMESKQIEDIINQQGQGLVRHIHLFDIYTGNHISKDKKSLAYNIQYQASDRTLVDEEVEAIQRDILTALAEIRAELRS